jgi:integrase
MGVTKYQSYGRTLWKVDAWLVRPDGPPIRLRQSKIPTREQAVALEAKLKTDAFDGQFFERHRLATETVAELWARYEDVGRRDNRSWPTDVGRAKHLLHHLGGVRATALSLRHVEEYRGRRLGERTPRGGPPSPATLDCEVELLKRVLNHAVRLGTLQHNPIAEARLLRKPNVRRVVVDEDAFGRLFEASEESFRPILLVAFDTGMRQREVLELRWEKVDLRSGTIELAPQDTKSEAPRRVVLTARVVEALRALPRGIGAAFVFPNPKTGKAWQDLRKSFLRAVRKAKLDGLWFHDLRRSFVTRARKAGIPESVVMRMSGHKTRAVFDRYNVVDESDLRIAARALENHGRVLDTVAVSEPKNTKAPPRK